MFGPISKKVCDAAFTEFKAKKILKKVLDNTPFLQLEVYSFNIGNKKNL
jgi:hypothetical protein